MMLEILEILHNFVFCGLSFCIKLGGPYFRRMRVTDRGFCEFGLKSLLRPCQAQFANLGAIC